MATSFKKENDLKDTTAKTHRSRDNKEIPTANCQKSNKKIQIEHNQKEMLKDNEVHQSKDNKQMTKPQQKSGKW